jgi:hypothetical protein
VNLRAINPTMGFIITFFFLQLVSLPAILLAQEINFANIVVNGTTTIGETDDNYICATIDWFPSDTCRYNYCMLQNSSAITLVSVYIYIYMSSLIYIYTTWFIYIFVLTPRNVITRSKNLNIFLEKNEFNHLIIIVLMVITIDTKSLNCMLDDIEMI